MHIIKFPKKAETIVAPIPPAKPQKLGFIGGVIYFIWLVTVLVWPVLRWVIAMEVLFQFVRMIWFWDAPEVNAGWTFLLHFTAFSALTYFVGVFEPKGAKL